MADEPDNLVLKMLREIREILDEHSKAHVEHRASFAELKKQIEDWQETTSTGVGFAAHAEHTHPGAGAGDRRVEASD